ncbi:MAG: ABC transporter permease subunit [Chloroflexi bacterium]|nr:ABC transporter permease subunit [Chloroflexota bacterium]
MTELWDGLVQALHLIVTFDDEVVDIAWRSLRVSAASTVLAALICIPLGGLISFRSFRGKRLLINVIQTFYSVPTVCVGLFVFLMLSRAGPLGGLGLLFTPSAMVVGQALLITPIMLGLTISALSSVDKNIRDTTLSLGASERQAIWAIIKEARFAISAAIVLGFGRAISEVGVAMMVGGNIRGFTQILTTAIADEANQGNVELALALGVILLAIALVVTLGVNLVQQRR